MERRDPAVGLEIRYRWGDYLLGAAYLGHSNHLYVGGSGSDFALDAEQLGGRSRFALARAGDDGRFAFCFDDCMTGELQRGGDAVPLRALRERSELGNDGSYSCALEPGERAWVDLGGVRAEICITAKPEQVRVSWHRRLDERFLNVLVLTSLIVAGFAITAVNYPQGADLVADDLARIPPRIVRNVIQSATPTPRLAQTVARLTRRAREPAFRRGGQEGRAGSPSAPDRSALMAPRGLSIDAHSLFPGGPMNPSGHGPGASLVLSKGGIGGELREALGHLSGPTFGDARGNYGLGERDNGPGGGGGPSIGLGHIDTRGIGHGLPATGPRLGPSGPKEVPKLPDPEVSPPTLEGVDKEMVRKVIHAHRNEVRFCYEQELTRAPDLTGKVTVKFIIAADGTVQSATVEQTTLANATVEHCVTSHVRAWLFPKLKAGGVVIVSYPFFFRSAGD